MRQGVALAERQGWMEVTSSRAVCAVQSGSYVTCLPVPRSHLFWLREQERGFSNNTYILHTCETQIQIFSPRSSTFRVGADFMMISLRSFVCCSIKMIGIETGRERKIFIVLDFGI